MVDPELTNRGLHRVVADLANKDFHVRVAACQQLAKYKGLASAPKAVEALSTKLNDIDDRVICSALESLSLFGEVATECLPDVFQLLEHLDWDISLAAERTLESLPFDPGDYVDTVSAIVSNNCSRSTTAVINLANFLKDRSVAWSKPLLRLFEVDENSRTHLLGVIPHWGEAGRSAEALLRGFLQSDPDRYDTRCTLIALGAIGVDLSDIHPEFSGMNENAAVKQDQLEKDLLDHFELLNEQDPVHLLEIAKEADHLDVGAVVTLSRMTLDVEECSQLLISLADSSDPTTRANLCTVITALDPGPTTEVIECLGKLLSDTNTDVVRCALSAIRFFGPIASSLIPAVKAIDCKADPMFVTEKEKTIRWLMN